MNSRTISFFFLLWICFLLTFPSPAQTPFRVMSYNVENLFDTLNAPGFSDEEFLPASERKWDSRRYWAKLGRLARVVAMAGGEVPPVLVGLCEVENDSVLADLTRRTHLGRLDYEFLAAHGSDARGMNVALLYQPLRFRLLSSRELPVPTAAGERPTRNILLASGRLQGGDTLDVFVCHLPSKRGGARFSEMRRLSAAQTIRQALDSLRSVRSCPRFLLMGDFNDELQAQPLRTALGIREYADTFSPAALCLPEKKAVGEVDVGGTYFFRGRWHSLDHILVSASLLERNADSPENVANCSILSHPMLLEWNTRKTQCVPKRTYLGTHYRGGVSDHLPIIFSLSLPRAQGQR